MSDTEWTVVTLQLTLTRQAALQWHHDLREVFNDGRALACLHAP